MWLHKQIFINTRNHILHLTLNDLKQPFYLLQVTYLNSKCLIFLHTIFLFNIHLNKILCNPVGFFPSLFSFPIPSFLSSSFYPPPSSCSPALLNLWPFLVCWTPCSVFGQVFSSCALPPNPCLLALTLPADFGCYFTSLTWFIVCGVADSKTPQHFFFSSSVFLHLVASD